MSFHMWLRTTEGNVNVRASSGTAAKIGECDNFFPNWQLHHFRVDQIVQPGRKWLENITCHLLYFTVKHRHNVLASKQFIFQIMKILFLDWTFLVLLYFTWAFRFLKTFYFCFVCTFYSLHWKNTLSSRELVLVTSMFLFMLISASSCRQNCPCSSHSVSVNSQYPEW